MTARCPGQDARNIRPEELICRVCGYKVEIFSDELKVKCPKCGNLACKDRLPSCIDWCNFARECVGEEKWKQLKGN